MYLKKLREQRSAKVKRMQEILAGAKGENLCHERGGAEGI